METAKATTFLGLLLISWCGAAGADTNQAKVSQDRPDGLVPILVRLPSPSFGVNGPLPFHARGGPHLEPLGRSRRPPFLAPAGVTNVAVKKLVTASDKTPHAGLPTLVTDGNKEATDEAVFELHRGKQWVQIDLGATHRIYAILIWHDHRYRLPVYYAVVVHASDGPDFVGAPQLIFNNDYQNVHGFGPGTELEYFETWEGKLIDTKGTKARYLRFYSNGNSDTVLNAYTEIEVYGLPAD